MWLEYDTTDLDYKNGSFVFKVTKNERMFKCSFENKKLSVCINGFSVKIR